jgi:NADH:ubiquinone oxidoreductase subunit 6 (subunit J)
MGQFLFFLLAIICVGSILAMIIVRDQAYNALLLVLAFASLGGLFGLLDAPFIAVVQIIIYAGAILVLFIFVIMMINLRRGLPPEKKKWTLYLSLQPKEPSPCLRRLQQKKWAAPQNWGTFSLQNTFIPLKSLRS